MRAILGTRIRERRRGLKLSQAELARRVGISPSYLNLIEHNKRPIGGVLLRRTADELELQVEELDGAAERRLLEGLLDIGHTPAVEALGVELEKAGELIGRYPGWARAIAALARSEKAANDAARALADRLTHDPFLADAVHRMLSRTAALRSAAEILHEYEDIDPATRGEFHAVLNNESRALTEVGEALATYFEKADAKEPDTALTPLDEVEALFEQRENRFDELEGLANVLRRKLPTDVPASRESLARALVEAEGLPTIAALVDRESLIETELARGQAVSALKRYTTEAVVAPLDAFGAAAAALEYDLEALAESYSISIEMVCRRLIAIPRGEGVPRFGYFRANAAGTIVETRNLPGLTAPRYASACPLWVLFRAQQSPEAVIRQRAAFPNGSRYVFLARARNASPTGFGRPRHYLTDMLAMTEADAAHTVYAPGDAVPPEAVGNACRSCPRTDCEHRVIDPLTG